MAYAYARRFAACALYLRGIIKKDGVIYACTIWYGYGRNINPGVEFQEKAADYSIEFLQTYDKRFTRDFVSKLSDFVIPKINKNEVLGIDKFTDGDDWLIDFIETMLNNNLKFRIFALYADNNTLLLNIFNKTIKDISNTFHNYTDVYEFICEQLDAASFGNAMSKYFVLNSGVPYEDYTGGMQKFEAAGGQILTNSVRNIATSLEVVTIMQLYILDRIMKKYGIGKYQSITIP